MQYEYGNGIRYLEVCVLTLSGKKVDCRDIVELPNRERMQDPDDDRYKYFKILELENIWHEDIKYNFITSYFKSLKHV